MSSVTEQLDDAAMRALDRGLSLILIAEIIERVEDRASCSTSWPICSTREELTDNELAEIYRLAKGLPQKQKETNANNGAIKAKGRSAYS